MPLGLLFSLFSIGSGLAEGLGALIQGNTEANRLAFEQRRQAVTAKSYEVAAAQRAANRVEEVNKVLAANLARAGAMGIASSSSAARIGERAIEKGNRDIDIERADAQLRADFARAYGASLSPGAARVGGYASAGFSVLRGLGKAFVE
jgi:hypothetical protein